MSSTTPNIGLTKTTAAETIGQNWAASNDSGGNFDIIDTKMGAVGNTSLQAQVTALNSKITNYLKSGTNNIGNIIVPGYNTGSGNYIDCFVPCSTGGKTVTAASASASTLVYLPTKRISFSSAPTITVLETNAYGVRLEIAYPSTETANITGTVYLVNLMLTCS